MDIKELLDQFTLFDPAKGKEQNFLPWKAIILWC